MKKRKVKICKVCGGVLVEDGDGIFCDNVGCSVRYADVGEVKDDDVKRFKNEKLELLGGGENELE